MAADYDNTARALALPIEDSDNESAQGPRPSWHRRSASLSQRRSLDSSSGYRDQFVQHASSLSRRLLSLWNRLTLFQKVVLAIAAIVVNTLLILFLIFNEKIFHFLGPYAEQWREVKGGWLVLWFAIVLVSFPPMIGYSSATTIAGFVYGMEGWFIVASATIVGSTISFVASRYVLTSYVHRLVANDTRFAALSLTLKHDGIKLLCMIRLCPLPYSLSNGAIATVPTVDWWSFALATAIVTPKLLIHVFIGSRLAAFGEGKMDMKTKALNWASVAFGLCVGAATGILIWRRTQARARELEAKEVENARADVGRDSFGTGQARPGSGEHTYSDDPAEQEAYEALRSGVRDDAISLRDQDEQGHEYRDFLSDEDELESSKNPSERQRKPDEEMGRPIDD